MEDIKNDKTATSLNCKTSVALKRPLISWFSLSKCLAIMFPRFVAGEEESILHGASVIDNGIFCASVEPNEFIGEGYKNSVCVYNGNGIVEMTVDLG